MARVHVVYAAVIAVLLLVIAGMAYVLLIAGKTMPLVDKRQRILLEPAERALVLEEMRAFLGAIQVITAALARGDMRAVAAAARAQGMAATRHVPASLSAKLPLEFKTLGMGVHQDFDHIALDAESLADPAHTLGQLGRMLGKCVACHGAYQIAADVNGPRPDE